MPSTYLISCHPASTDAALNELHEPSLLRDGLSAPPGRLLQVLEPGTFLYAFEGADSDVAPAMRALDPIFIRHIHPVTLTASAPSLGDLEALAALPSGTPVALQLNLLTRDRDAEATARRLTDELARLGHPVDPEATDTTLSVTCDADRCYLGLSSAADNLSAWPGGRTRYRKRHGQLSRAAFKLEEAFDHFGIGDHGGHAVDLGAAPGSWTELLVHRGYRVTAVDPAALDPSLTRHPMVRNFRGTAEAWLAGQGTAALEAPVDLLVNDMKMDVRPSADIVCEMLPALAEEGRLVMTFKLPRKRAVSVMRQGLERLKPAFRVLRAKQLHHNRSEVTVYGAGPVRDV